MNQKITAALKTIYDLTCNLTGIKDKRGNISQDRNWDKAMNCDSKEA